MDIIIVEYCAIYVITIICAYFVQYAEVLVRFIQIFSIC